MGRPRYLAIGAVVRRPFSGVLINRVMVRSEGVFGALRVLRKNNENNDNTSTRQHTRYCTAGRAFHA